MKTMKTKWFMASSLLVFCLTITACGSRQEAKQEATEEAAGELVYACPMHPEVTGKANDTCGKCGMALEKVEKTDSTEHHNH